MDREQNHDYEVELRLRGRREDLADGRRTPVFPSAEYGEVAPVEPPPWVKLPPRFETEGFVYHNLGGIFSCVDFPDFWLARMDWQGHLHFTQVPMAVDDAAKWDRATKALMAYIERTTT